MAALRQERGGVTTGGGIILAFDRRGGADMLAVDAVDPICAHVSGSVEFHRENGDRKPEGDPVGLDTDQSMRFETRRRRSTVVTPARRVWITGEAAR
jgi:hypothetical protein